MSSCVVSEYSTIILLQPAHAEYQQLMPAGRFPLISNVGPAHHTQKLIRDNEC